MRHVTITYINFSMLILGLFALNSVDLLIDEKPNLIGQ